MAKDLAGENGFEVSVADKNRQALDRLGGGFPIKTVMADLSDPADVGRLADGYDLVISAVPGFMGYRTLEAVIKAGRNVVDIAFFPEDPFTLDRLASEKGVVAIMDCGVAPGMSNILTAHADHLLDETETAITYVGGLPLIREWPYEYKAVFSPLDVIEEYTRPARYIENGVPVVRPALSDPELIHFPEIGTLEAFNSDGLRTLAKTIKAPNLKEKTLRYPGHIEKMAVLKDTGFFSKKPVEIDGRMVRPLDFTAKLLFPKWELRDGDIDMTIMRVIVEGRRGGVRLRHTYDLFDTFDRETGVHSMARTTGYTATMALRMIAEGLYVKTGISPPEFIGRQPECVEFMRRGLEERGIVYRETVENI